MCVIIVVITKSVRKIIMKIQLDKDEQLLAKIVRTTNDDKERAGARKYKIHLAANKIIDGGFDVYSWDQLRTLGLVQYYFSIMDNENIMDVVAQKWPNICIVNKGKEYNSVILSDEKGESRVVMDDGKECFDFVKKIAAMRDNNGALKNEDVDMSSFDEKI